MGTYAVWGCGSIGTRRARILRELGHTVHVWDLDEARMEAVGYGTTPGLPELFEAVGILICTPAESDRAAQFWDAIQHEPKGVFVEKPVSTQPYNLMEIDRFAHQAATRGIRTMGACNMRFAETTCQGRPFAHHFGRWAHAHFVMRQASHLWSRTHRPITLALDSIHEFDLALAVMGPVTGVRGFSSLDKCIAILDHEGGGRSIIDMDREADPPERYVRLQDRDGSVYHVEYGMERMYHREMEDFVKLCENPHYRSTNPIEMATKTCRIALKVVQP